MIKLKELITYLNEYLEVAKTRDVAINGLQVEGKDTIERIVVGVSATVDLFKKALDKKADLILVHHGLFWGSPIPIKGYMKKRIEALVKNDVSLAAYHLPLDMHPIVGNNAQLSKVLEIKDVSTFGNYKGSEIGVKGFFEKPQKLHSIASILNKTLETDPYIFDFGSREVKSVAIVSGGASDMIHQAIEEEVDLFITGEPSEYMQSVCKESNINFICAGHYNSEKLGIIALGNHIKDFYNIDVEYVDIPNPF
jgi:dinuclear metal center YbgI/SA1388 family protein